jgi:hypothetical protein
MRLHRRVSMVAAVLAAVGSFAPAAYGFERAGAPAGTGQPPTLVQPHSSGSDDWAIGIGAVGGLAVIGTGLVATRSRARKRQQVPAVPAS